MHRRPSPKTPHVSDRLCGNSRTSACETQFADDWCKAILVTETAHRGMASPAMQHAESAPEALKEGSQWTSAPQAGRLGD